MFATAHNAKAASQLTQLEFSICDLWLRDFLTLRQNAKAAAH